MTNKLHKTKPLTGIKPDSEVCKNTKFRIIWLLSYSHLVNKVNNQFLVLLYSWFGFCFFLWFGSNRSLDFFTFLYRNLFHRSNFFFRYF